MVDTDKDLIKAYAADLLNDQVSYLENQIEGLLYEENVEYVHHTRVMSRRIRNTLSMFSQSFGKKNSKKWFSSMKNLTKSLTKVRDLDVQILFLENEISDEKNQKFIPGLERLLLRKQQKRVKKQKLVHSSILNFEKTNTLQEMKLFIDQNPMDKEGFSPPQLLIKFGRNEVSKLTKNCFSYVPFITSPDNTKSLHKLRIAIKNLRYTVELFQPLFPNLEPFIKTFKNFQDDLGAIHDSDIWIIELDKFVEKETKRIGDFYGQTGPFNFIKPGILNLREKIENQKIEIHKQFLVQWNEDYQNQFWTNLQLVFKNIETE